MYLHTSQGLHGVTCMVITPVQCVNIALLRNTYIYEFQRVLPYHTQRSAVPTADCAKKHIVSKMTTLHTRRPAPYNHRYHYGLRSQRDLPSQTSTRVPIYHDADVDAPWHHMAQTYEWVIEQEFMTLDKCNRKTEQWILEQQIFLAANNRDRRSGRGPAAQRGLWEEMAYTYEVEAERWMQHEEEARRKAAEREKEKARIVEEEVRRIESRIRNKREAERRKFAEEKARAYAGRTTTRSGALSHHPLSRSRFRQFRGR